MKSKVGLGTFTNLIDTNLSQLSPPSKNNHAIISTYAAGDRLLNFKQETASMFPDTGAKVTVTKTTTPDFRQGMPLCKMMQLN